MEVRDGMSHVVLTVGPGHTLREAAKRMTDKGVGAAVVIDEETPGPRVVSERDVLNSLGRGEDPDAERVGDHMSDTVISAAPEWSLERAAVEMARRHIRHLVVVERGELVGVLDARHRPRLDVRGRHLGDDARNRVTKRRIWAELFLEGHRGDHRRGDPLLARQAGELAAGVADPRPERGQGDERADDAVRPPGEQRSDHPGQAGGEQRRLPRRRWR